MKFVPFSTYLLLMTASVLSLPTPFGRINSAPPRIEEPSTGRETPSAPPYDPPPPPANNSAHHLTESAINQTSPAINPPPSTPVPAYPYAPPPYPYPYAPPPYPPPLPPPPPESGENKTSKATVIIPAKDIAIGGMLGLAAGSLAVPLLTGNPV